MKLPILQSGFLGLNEEGLVRSEALTQSKIFRSIELGKPIDEAGNAFFYNKDIEALYQRYNNDHRLLKQFEFREELLKLSKVAFGTFNLETWFSIQLKSPNLTATHRRFLNDTLLFIYEGRREVNIETWMGLIYPRTATSSDAKTDLELKDYFIQNNGWSKISSKLPEAIAQWTSKANGFYDLMVFLTIVFSKQSSMTL